MKQLVKRIGAAIGAGAAIALLVVTPATTYAAYDPSPWTGVLLPAPAGYSPTTSNTCPDGSTTCVDNAVTKLQTQLNPLLATCDHKLIFNFFYLRVTQAYRSTINDPTYFQNVKYVNQEDAVFASYYFNQYNAWKSGNLAAVSPAWQLAFKANDTKQVNGLGDALLSINAHILHDEPYVLDQMGLTYADGSSAKPDYNKDNDWLYATEGPTLNETARRFDSTMASPSQTNLASYQAIAGWREQAWRFAEQLKAAEATHNTTAYKAVQAEIDAQTVANAHAIIAATTNTPQQTASRDAYCAVHKNDQ